MKFKSFVVFMVVFAFLFAACAPEPADVTVPQDGADGIATDEPTEAVDEPAAGDTSDMPAACQEDEFGCAVIPEGETIKIGMGAPLLGDYSMFGIDISQAVELALAQDDGFEGWTYELVAEDTGGAPEGGAAVANKMVTDDTVVAIAGHIFSGSTEAAMPIYEKAGLPMMSSSATNPGLTQSGSTVFNRLAFTDADQGAAAADLLFNKFGFTKLAVLHDGGTYGQGLADVVKEKFEEMGGEIVAYEGITTGEADYVAVLSAVAAVEPEAVYFGGYAAESIVLMNQWTQAGLDGVQFFGSDGTYGVEFTDKTGANGEGAVAASLVPPDSDEKTAFDAAYADTYPTKAGELSAFTWSSFDTGNVLISAIESVAFVENGSVYVPRGALIEAVRTTNFEGLTGAVICDEIGECNASGPTFYQVVDGVWVPMDLSE